MSELENIENSQEVETIPTDNTTEELQENVEERIVIPEDDNSAEIEAEQERLRQEHSVNVANARFIPCQGNI